MTFELHPVIVDCDVSVAPMEAVIATITGQPMSYIRREVPAAHRSLRALGGADQNVEGLQLGLTLLSRFGYGLKETVIPYDAQWSLQRTLECAHQFDTAYRSQHALVVCSADGSAHAFLGDRLAGSSTHAPLSIRDWLHRKLDLSSDTIYAAFFHRRVKVLAVQSPDHLYIRLMASEAVLLAAQHHIQVRRLNLAYWELTFPRPYICDSTAVETAVVCGVHDLLTIVRRFIADVAVQALAQTTLQNAASIP